MLVVVFERFTDRARRVLVLAQEEARELRHNFIGTEHLLLGLLAEGEGVAAKALESLEIGIEDLRAKVGEAVGPSESQPTGSPPFTPRAKKVLELGLRQALQLGHNYIGTEHILLGLLREGEGVAVQVLTQIGAEPDKVRQAVMSLLRGETGSTVTTSVGPVPSGGSRGTRWLSPPGIRPPGRVEEHRRTDPYVSGPVSVNHEGGRLVGTVAGQPVDLSLQLPASSGTATGSLAGLPVSVGWRLASNDEWAPDVPGWLGGSVGGKDIGLRAWFHLDQGVVFDSASVEGYCGDLPVSVFARATVPGLRDGSFLIDGTYAGAGFSLTGTVRVGGGSLDGAVDGRQIELRVAETDGGTSLSVSGDFHGPASLLGLISACLIFFAR